MSGEEKEFLQRVQGLYVGLLDADELKMFDDLCNRGFARRSYEGAAGFLGLPKVAPSPVMESEG